MLFCTVVKERLETGGVGVRRPIKRLLIKYKLNETIEQKQLFKLILNMK